MSTFDPVRKAKGDAGEADLRAWFDRHGFGYVAVCQHQQTFATLFRDQVKRPDFLLLIDSLGIIAVDAKHKSKSKQRDSYTLSYDYEFRRALMFERIFRLPVWYAYHGPDADTWYWISALKAFEVGRRKGPKTKLARDRSEALRMPSHRRRLRQALHPTHARLRQTQRHTLTKAPQTPLTRHRRKPSPSSRCTSQPA